jgi:hypothetical protein
LLKNVNRFARFPGVSLCELFGIDGLTRYAKCNGLTVGPHYVSTRIVEKPVLKLDRY